MSDSNPAASVDPRAEEDFEGSDSRSTRAECCRLCGRKNVGDVVDAGGDIGTVHRACFIEWDCRQEALEAAAMVALAMPDPREEWSEGELDDSETGSHAA